MADNKNSVALFRNDKRETEKHPEYSDKSGKTIVEFLNEERKKYEQPNQI